MILTDAARVRAAQNLGESMEFTWNESYSVGNEIIDNDHRGLFDTLNSLESAAKWPNPEDIAVILETLIDYTRTHFQREERLMRGVGYPEFDEHQAKHDAFTRKVLAIRKIYHEDPDSVDLVKLVEFLRGWLLRHILGSDRDYIPFLDGAGEALMEPADASVGENLTLEVQVPEKYMETIARCAILLQSGDAEARSLADYVRFTFDEMEPDEARKLAAGVLAGE